MMAFFTNLWRKITNTGSRWPKTVVITVRDGDCRFLDRLYVDIYNWNDVMKFGESFCQEVMRRTENENLDEVYWEYEEYK